MNKVNFGPLLDRAAASKRHTAVQFHRVDNRPLWRCELTVDGISVAVKTREEFLALAMTLSRRLPEAFLGQEAFDERN